MPYDIEQMRKLVLDQLTWDSRIDSKNISVEVTDHKVTLLMNTGKNSVSKRLPMIFRECMKLLIL